MVAHHLTVARIAEALDVSWDTANDAVLAEGRRLLIDDTARFDGVRGEATDRCFFLLSRVTGTTSPRQRSGVAGPA